MINKHLRTFATLFAAILVLAAAGFAQTSPSKDFPGIKISNFGKMDDNFYRGAQPKSKDFPALKALGIHTVIDLTTDSPDEQAAVEAAGMKYINIPIKDKSYPTDENVAAFLKTINDKETGVFYVHCAGGRHRTGDMGALYRFTKDGWDYDKVYKEMENYDFYTSNGHQKAKDFVVDYSAKMVAQKAAAAAAKTMATAQSVVPTVTSTATVEQSTAPAEKVSAPATPVEKAVTPAAPVEKTVTPAVKSTTTTKKSSKMIGSRRSKKSSRLHSGHSA